MCTRKLYRATQQDSGTHQEAKAPQLGATFLRVEGRSELRGQNRMHGNRARASLRAEREGLTSVVYTNQIGRTRDYEGHPYEVISLVRVTKFEGKERCRYAGADIEGSSTANRMAGIGRWAPSLWLSYHV